MSTTIKNINDVISLSEIFTSDPTGLIKDLEDTLTLSSIFSFEFRSNLLFKSFEDAISVGETFGSAANERTVYGILDSMSIQDIFDARVKLTPIKSFEDAITLVDEFIIQRTRAKINIKDSLTITDIFTADYSTNNYVSILNNMALSDEFFANATEHFARTIMEQMNVNDIFVQQWGIIVIGGTGTGGYDTGEIVQLQATPLSGYTFFKWIFPKSGLSNIYDPQATITVPQGGGVVTAVFTQNQSPVDILDIFDFTYIDNDDHNDEITTSETPISTSGGVMSVAKHNYEIPQGARFHNIIIYRDVDGVPVDLSGYTAEMQIRQTKESADPALLTLNTSNGYLTLDGATGTITIDVSANITDALDFVWARYDLELYPAGDTDQAIRLLEGKINLNKQITQ